VKAGPVRITRRTDASRAAAVTTSLLAALFGLILSGLVIQLAGHSAVDTFRKVFEQSLSGADHLSATFVSATPLILTGLAAAVAFRARVWNIGGEGQMYIGAITGAAAGIALGGFTGWIAVPAMIVAGCIGGAAWAAIPAVLRAYCRTSETLTSLMLNYIAGLILVYLIFDSFSYWRDTTSPGANLFPQGKTLSESTFWPGLTGLGLLVPLGFLLGIILAFGLYVYIRSTRAGYTLRFVADSPMVALYGGMRPARTLIAVMLISGAFAGLAGASQVGDFTHVLAPSSLMGSSFGYTGIVVAALARLNPIAVIPSAIFFGALTNAGLALQGPDFPRGLVGVAAGIILFSLLGGEMLVRYRITASTTGRPEPPSPEPTASHGGASA